MELSQYLVAIARDGAAYAELVGDHLAAPVPSCPGWTIADLTFHLGEVDHFWRQIVEHRHGEPDRVGAPPRPGDDHLVAWYLRELADLERVLAQADPDAQHWTWSEQRNTAFVIRRMAHETAVHVWDARHALGEDRAIPADLADDGIDEFLAHFAPARREGAAPVVGRVEFVSADTGHTAVTGFDGEAKAVVSGSASDLLLVLWRRLTLDAVDVVGDRALAAAFVDGTALI